uniref:Wsv262 n=1 Tax=White spot syndrome virus TaxID=92652 RepID=A0A2U9G8L3_WSSV|nr:wsv262 [Shrimp white spot syndrome virus]AWQ62139.1 wsv262 [Shrimp white spot syndrome virus]AWQ62937.1 wsv262 [Shrimp white spot syndrome virus]AWQ63363.1 wsv262 [Shrimp white spot syndrome virus]AWQ63763.1 wsv262 [Shrimp white spot syndrome virus]
MFLSYQRTDQLLSVYLYADTPLDASPTHSTCPLSSSLLSCSLPELRLLRIVCTSSLQRRRMRMKMRRIRDLICKQPVLLSTCRCGQSYYLFYGFHYIRIFNGGGRL